jgi:non-specific serine/threonine protein kinase
MRCPPIVGAEYLDAEVLESWWSQLDALVTERMANAGSLNAFLAELNPAWHAVGRVTFHLAENKRDPEHPFAFLATYVSGVSAQGKPQHVPLARALSEFAGAKNRAALINLLKPVNDAAANSALARQLIDEGDLYQTLIWTPSQAYAFLRDVPHFESAGLMVRVPDWWRARRTARPKVSVKIGDAPRKGAMSVDALLDFNVRVTLEDDALTDEELAKLLESDEQLVQLRGKWVEIDAEKLKQAMAHWKRVEQFAEDGIQFIDAMRMLSGVPSGAEAATDEAAIAPEWVGIEPGEWLGQTLARLRKPKAAEPPTDLRATLRPYQKSGYGWLRFMSELRLGACLADDMGLGKTVQVIALLLHHYRAGAKRSPSLLVVPASLIPNWRAELERFAPSIRAWIAHPSENDLDDDSLKRAFKAHDLIITTYAMLTRTDALREPHWSLAILDEAQAIKNSGTRQSRAVKQLKADARIALSGTPIENRLSDLWSLFDFLNPGLLGDAKAFSKLVKKLSDDEAGEGFAPLRALIKPYVLRRLKTDKSIIRDLPDKTELKAFCPLSKRQANLYQQAVDEMADALDSAEPGIQRQGLVLSYLIRFKQICNHPAQAIGDGDFAPAASGKFERLAEICAELAERQQRVLVFTQFKEMTEPLAAHLASVFGRGGLVLHGSTSLKARKEMVERFQHDDGPPFFVLSIRAGGTGLNLTAAANVIHFDRWWNPAVENQATDRAFRIGQKQNVLVHKFICRGTVEERIDAMIEEKSGLADDLLGEAGPTKLITELNDADLLKFVSLDLRRATAES